MKSDEKLMLAYCGEDSATFGELFSRYVPATGICLRRVSTGSYPPKCDLTKVVNRCLNPSMGFE